MKPPYLDEAERAGYRFPVAITRDAFDRYVTLNGTAAPEGQDSLLRLWDILWMSRAAANSGAPPGSVVPFSVFIEGDEVTLTLSIRELADGPYILIGLAPEFTYIVVDEGELRVVRGSAPTSEDLVALVGGGIDGVPVPPPTREPVIGYCNKDGFQRSLGANCYVLGLRYPIPGPLVVLGVAGDAHRPLTEEEVAAFSMEWLPGRSLPTLCMEGFQEERDNGDPAARDPYRPGVPFAPPPMTVEPWRDE